MRVHLNEPLHACLYLENVNAGVLHKILCEKGRKVHTKCMKD